jgi:hypothetical protein
MSTEDDDLLDEFGLVVCGTNSFGKGIKQEDLYLTFEQIEDLAKQR